jgi:hypothetical protein
MTDDQHKIILLEKEVEGLNTQLKRFISHVESEQRVTTNISKRVDSIENLTDKHEKMLINTGQGVMFRVDRMEQRESRSKSSIQMWISVLAIIISVLTLIATYVK